MNPKLRPIPYESLKKFGLPWTRDDNSDFTKPGEHECAEGIIKRRLVVHWQKML